MARLRYYVFLREDQWGISFQGEHYGPYKSQRDAFKAAVFAAHESGEQGLDACVLVQGADNQLRTQWTFGRDPFPPIE